MTIEEVCSLEPAVASLLDEARAWPAEGNYCGDDVFYGHFKPQIVTLIGWQCASLHGELHTPDAYECVVRAVLEALPPCAAPERCGCLAVA